MFTYKNMKISILAIKGRIDWKAPTALWAVFYDWEGTTIFQDALSIFIFSFLFFSFLFPALDTDEHIEIPEDTISWLAGIACKYFYIT